MNHGWEKKRLGDIASYVNGFAFKPSDWKDSGYPIIRIQNLNNMDAEFNYSDGCVPSKYFVYEGDLLISWSASLGAYVWKGEKAVLNQHIFKVVFDKSDIQRNFLKYYVDFSLPLMIAQTHGATMKHITKSRFDSFPIPYPSVEEQSQIISELDKLNELIEIKRNQLKDLDALAQSLFYESFGDPIENPNGFQISPLSAVFELITDGTHQTPIYSDDIKNSVKFLSAKDVVNGYIDWTNIKYIPFELHLELHKRLAPQRGDILLCKNGTTGICALVETDDIFDIYVSLALLRPKKNTCAKYLVYAINNPFTKEQFNHSLKGIGVPNLHLNKIRSTRIIVPPLSLQNDFVAKIEAIEEQKRLIEASIADLETLLESRMDYWFND